ncbi:MAG: hypothetical protein ACI4I5_02140 [Acutalibacteraceae bacterium]
MFLKKISTALLCLLVPVSLATCGKNVPAASSATPSESVDSSALDTNIDIADALAEATAATDIQAQTRVFKHTDGTVEEYIVLNLDFSGYWITDSAYPIKWDVQKITLFPGTEDMESFAYVCGGGTLTVDGKTFTAVQEMPQEVSARIGA